MGLVFEYAKELYSLSRIKVALNVLLMVLLGMVQGMGILLIIPLLSVTGVVPDMQSSSELTVWVNYVFHKLGLPVNLLAVLALYLGINFLQSWLERYQVILTTEIQHSFMRLLAVRFFRAITYAEWQLIITRKKSDITNILISVLTSVSGGTATLFNMIAAALITAFQITLAFIVAPVLTGLILTGAAVLMVILRSSAEKSRQRGRAILELNKNSLTDISDTLQGMKEVKSYGNELAQINKFSNTIRLISKNYMGFLNLQIYADMLYKVGAAVFISFFLFCAVVIFKLQPQELILIAVISSRLWPRFSSLQKGFQSLQVMLPAFQSVRELESECLAAQEYFADHNTLQQVEVKSGLEFSHVSFYYTSTPEKLVVEDANFFLPAGTTTAFVGASGSGKSTLVNLLMGLLVPIKGDILIDGNTVRDRLRPWRNSIGYVAQDSFMTNASIRENLLWVCPGASEEEMWEALRMAAADSFVVSLTNGLDTVVGDRGVRLSGGERQRIVLARALLRKPSVLILDEATSSLDMENEKNIQRAIDNLHGTLTIIIIAHRISTIRNADQIFVLEQGRIVEWGNYQSLMRNKDSWFYASACLYAE